MECNTQMYTRNDVYKLSVVYWTASVFSCCLENPQDVDEEVDEVKVEVNGGKDVLLRWELVHDDVSVKDDEATEEQSTTNGENKLKSLAPEEQLPGGGGG